MAVRRFSGDRLREAREEALLSQRELAAKAGVSHATIARLETSAEREPQFRTIRKLSEALNVEPNALYGEEASEGRAKKLAA
jgi:transcriptional regulator with XRE-family HTH domain